MKQLHINYEFDEKYKHDPVFDEALAEFLNKWGWKRVSSGQNLIKHEGDMYFEKDSE